MWRARACAVAGSRRTRKRRARGGQDPEPSRRRAGALLFDRELVVVGAIGEVLLLHGFPAAQKLFHGESLDRRELGGVRLQHGFVARTQVVLGDDRLAFRRIKEAEVRLGELAGAALVDDLVDEGDRRLGMMLVFG